MKVRTGFVSNSSSTSYIVAVTSKAIEPCSRCGRSDMVEIKKLFSYIDRADESSVVSGVQEDLATQQQELKFYQEEIAEAQRHDPTEKYPKDWYFSYGAALDSYRTGLAETQAEIVKLQAFAVQHDQLYTIELTYHDELLNKLFQDAIKNGQLIVLSRY